MSRWSPFALVVAMLCASGCAPDAGPAAGRAGARSEALAGFERPGRMPLDADLSAPPAGSVSFWIMGDEWREDVGAPLFRGAEATITVWPERLPRCGADADVTAVLVPDEGETLEVSLEASPEGGPLRGSFLVPDRARELETWILAEGPGGCVEHDSDFGRNYRLPVHLWAPTTIRFGADWSEVAEGPLLRGGVIAVAYDLDRLPDCRIIYRGFPGWEILAHASFDGVEVPGHGVVRPGDGGPASLDREPALAFFAIPWDATEAELWFENRQYPPTCQAWDSDYGANYPFPLVDAGSLAAPPGTRLVFGPDWHEHATGPLFAGAEVAIEAAPDRFPRCGVSGSVSAGLRLEGGEVLAVSLDEATASGGRLGRLRLPPSAAGRIEVWLRSVDGPCEEYDSDFGRDYPFAVVPWEP